MWRLLRLGGIVAGALSLALAAGFVCFVASLERLERDPAAPADGIVALTGGAQRIEDALALLARGFGSRLLITGVNERTSREEISRASPHLRSLVECCVDLDYRARNTIGNALETQRWSQANRFGSLIVVTSNYHMPRTMAELDHVLPGARKVAYPVVAATPDESGRWPGPAAVRVLLSEYAKYLVVVVRNRTASLLSARAAAVTPRAE